MRTSLKKPKPKTPTILQQQSTKLKQKLQLLREQVTQKKQQKEMNKTATSLQSASKPLSLNQTQNKLLSQTVKVNMSKRPDAKLKSTLQQAKLESLEEKLKEKGINTYDRFVELLDEEVDEWKDVAVGWRIKLKKLVKMCKEKKQSGLSGNESMAKLAQKPQFLTTQYPPPAQHPQQKNIQDIIRDRKQAQIFIPICRQIQQLPQQQYSFEPTSQMTQHDQDVIIQSFMKVFQPRRGIISMQSRIGQSTSRERSQKSHEKDKKVSWSKKVQQMEKDHLQKAHKKYPKQAVGKWAFSLQKQDKINSSQTIPQSNPQSLIKYCWKCFRKINLKENIGFRISEQIQNGAVKYFCCVKCQQLYEREVNEFRGQLEEEGNAKDHSLEMEKESIYQQESEDIETIDLSIL